MVIICINSKTIKGLKGKKSTGIYTRKINPSLKGTEQL
jgi:hypothetical protein